MSRASDNFKAARQQFHAVDFIETELSKLESVEVSAERLIRKGKKIDVLINNAALQSTPTFLEDDFRYEQIRREIDVNFTSVCCLTHLLLPLLVKDTQSVIMNINSGLAIVPKTSSAVYCATKGALNIFSQSLRHQLENTNIDVKQCLLPLVETKMTEGRGSKKLTAQHAAAQIVRGISCLLYTSPSPRDLSTSRMPSSA